MKLDSSHSDTAILTELGARLAEARVTRNLTQDQLSAEAGISKRTLERLESGQSIQLATLIRVLRALDLSAHLDLLIPAPTASPLAQLELQGRRRERASRSARSGKSQSTEWSWDDDA
jgi:transcriptional regulator with XRE-family HTH domain